ncbi:MAG: diphosphomevalonate decarboxylase [Anaerolineae bacterium]
MRHMVAAARSFSNIAFIKYWGNRDNALRLPANGSISMNLAGIETVTTVQFDPTLRADTLLLNGKPADSPALERVTRHLDHLRRLAGVETRAAVESHNNFPTGAGIASSASAFSALTLAAAHALGLDLSERDLSILARLGSGSASRSIPGGFVEWYVGTDHATSFAESIAPAEHWDLVDLIAIVSTEHKAVGSTGGHVVAPTSPLQAARVADTDRRLGLCRRAILARDFEALTGVIEQDALLMHAVMMTSVPSLVYWQPATLRVIEAVRAWRAEGLAAAFTIDAGPNVHVITLSAHRAQVEAVLRALDGVQDVRTATPGGPAHLIDIPPAP